MLTDLQGITPAIAQLHHQLGQYADSYNANFIKEQASTSQPNRADPYKDGRPETRQPKFEEKWQHLDHLD